MIHSRHLLPNTPLKRRTFIKMSGLTLSGIFFRLNSIADVLISVKGNVFDLLGFPVADADISLVTGYSFLADDGLHITAKLKDTKPTDTQGSFAISFLNPSQDISLRVTSQNELQQIVVKQVTGTNIPFYNAEVWSVDRNKKVNELNNNGLLDNISIYIDPSRKYIWDYFSNHHSWLVAKLKNNNSGYEEPWEGNHINPDDNLCYHCDDHYYDPLMEKNKNINIPWGSNRGVIPFAFAEGKVYWTNDEYHNDSHDGDWEWELILEPQYGYLPNAANKNLNLPPPSNSIYQFHCEMCRWFMGKESWFNPFNPGEPGSPVTNVRRNQNLDSLKKTFNGHRIWMVGSWTVDDSHHQNEIHPVYWVVYFTGGWRRFYASEILRANLNTNGANRIIAINLPFGPQDLLVELSTSIAVAMSNKTRGDAIKFYLESIVHLNKFGLNSAFPKDAADPANSIKVEDFQREASILSVSQMAENITHRYNIIFNHLTTLGAGVFVFPMIIFVYEGTDIIQQADKLGLTRPGGLYTTLAKYIQVSLGKQALLFEDSIIENGLTILKLAYESLFNKMKLAGTVTAAQIAEYYANTSVRLINYGMYEDNDPKHSPRYTDHYNWALPSAKSHTEWLLDSINVRLTDLWNDAFPFTRKI